MNKSIQNLVEKRSHARSIKKQQRVILLALDWSREKDTRMPLGHMSILSCLFEKKIAVIPIVQPVYEINLKDLCQRIVVLSTENTYHTDLAIGVYCWNDRIVKQLLPLLRQCGFKGRIILGGPQVSFVDGDAYDIYPDADVCIFGDGEDALARVVLSFPKILEIRGIRYRNQAHNCQDQARSNLDSLPSPWLQNLEKITNKTRVRWETMRGCPYTCNFCQHHKRQSNVRHFNWSRISKEIDFFCNRNVASITVLDPVFNINADWALRILEKFRDQKFKGRITLQCRAELITDDFLNVARLLNATLEFGLQTIHEAESIAIDRKNDLEKVDKALEMTRSYDVNHEISLIFGLPCQTAKSFSETVEWCLVRKIPVIKAFPLMLLKGTKLARESSTWCMEESDTVIPWVKSTKTFSEIDWLFMDQISYKLQQTEGKHPQKLSDLMIVDSSLVNPKRWSPDTLNCVCNIAQ